MKPINYYQPWLFPFLTAKKQRLQTRYKRYFYHSFEDALWDLLQNHAVPRDAAILIPNFYCMDVVENISLHGYRPVMYPLDDHLQISAKMFLSHIQKQNPAVIIILHVSGITSKLFIDTSWMRLVPDKTVIIEDSVHRIVEPSRIHIYRDTHYIIDSLRKTTPLPGSFLYGTKKGLSFTQCKSLFNPYTITSAGYYILFRFLYTLGVAIRSATFIRYAHEVLLKKHDNLIGDRIPPSRGMFWSGFFADRFDFRKIEKRKIMQSHMYASLLSWVPESFYPIHIPVSDYGKLHAFPIGFFGKPDDAIITYLHSKGIIVWFKFPDATWCSNRGIIFLPLGFHVDTEQIKHTTETIKSWTPTKTIIYSTHAKYHGL